MMWKSFSVAVVAVLVQHVAAQNINVGKLLRFSCNQLVIERIDPLVNPGMSPSSHTHQIVGGNSFNSSMNPSQMDPANESTCTTCTFSEDFSNYWTASLYFKSPENGSYKLVPQKYNFVGVDNVRHPQTGGLTIYYMTAYGGNGKTTAFKPGFRMLTGEPSLRAKSNAFKGICHRCNTGNGFGGAPCSSSDTSELPLKLCAQGIRATITFPSCWDGKNIDSPDHRSHVAYSPSGMVLADAKCPATHPVRIPQLMYEIQWDTSQFNKPEYFQAGKKQPFVYSFGDGSGHGQHGDYLFGWKGDALQRGMDAVLGKDCVNDACPVLKSQSAAEVMKCAKPTEVDESVGRNGEWLAVLPGNPTVTYR